MRKLWTLMSSPRGRSVVAVFVLVLLGVAAVNLDHRTTRERAHAWVAAHSRSTIALEELAAYPVNYRQVIFDALPASEQSRLWQTQLRRVLDTDSDLNAEQRAFLIETIAKATPASFDKNVPAPNVCADVARLFTNKAQRDRVRTIGNGIAQTRSVGSAWVIAKEKMRSAVLVNAGKNQCDCSGIGTCECWLTTLSPCESGDCEPGGSCGCIWGGECDKMCGSSILSLKAPAPIK